MNVVTAVSLSTPSRSTLLPRTQMTDGQCPCGWCRPIPKGKQHAEHQAMMAWCDANREEKDQPQKKHNAF